LTRIDTLGARHLDPPSTTPQQLDFGGGLSLVVPPSTGAVLPSGARSGEITATSIEPHAMPGALPDGSKPEVLVELGPSGTKFDDPCKLTFPNPQGLAPGTVVNIISTEDSLDNAQTIGTGRVVAYTQADGTPGTRI